MKIFSYSINLQHEQSCDKDCLEDLPIQLEPGSNLSDHVTIVKSRCVEVVSACINVEAVAFNKGFYAVDITYTFRITLDTYESACSDPCTVHGRAVFTKKVILYGSEGNAKVFTSTQEPVCTPCGGNYCPPDGASLPKATVQVVEPIVLDAKLITKYCCEPQMPSNCGCSCPCEQRKVVCGVAVTLGIFSIIQLSRAVSVMIPVYDYCVPQKECCITSTETPCEMFEKIQFPTNVFFPPSMDCEPNVCGCSHNDQCGSGGISTHPIR